MAKFNDWEYSDDKTTISVVGGTPKNRKKIGGTRLGAWLGVNKWKTPFEAWCEIMRVGEVPFEGSIYTEAGNAIEPKIMAWCKENISPYIVSPDEWFQSSRKLYDYFPEQEFFGGMWDGLVLDAPFADGGQPIAVIEAKTSQRPQDWVEGVPAAYAAQALSYAYLLGVERVFVPVSFLEKEIYDDPSVFECTDTNTRVYTLEVSKSDITEQMDVAEHMYDFHVRGNISPRFDEKKDEKILSIIRKREVTDDTLEQMSQRATELEVFIEAEYAQCDIKNMEKELKVLKDTLKKAIIPLFTEIDETISAYGYKVKKSEKEKIDEAKLKDDGLFDDYKMTTVSFTITKEK